MGRAAVKEDLPEDKKTMILYIGASIYHILCFSLHKLIFHPEEKAVLVICDNIFSKSGMEELKADIDEADIFSRTIILHYIEGAYNNPYVLTETSDAEQIDKYIAWNEQWIEQWMAKNKLDLSQMTECNTAIDHRHFGLYLLSKKIPYQYFEDGNGLLSREQVQMEFHKKSQYASYAVTKRLHALGNSSYVTKRYANASAQVPGFYDEKMEDFNVISLFAGLKSKDKDRLLKMFHAEKITLPDAKGAPVLYLTRYVRYLQKPTIQNHHYLSAMILDLFAGDHLVVIKPHPRDFSGRYRDLFPDAVVLDKHFPSELLPFLYDGRFHKIITIGSTAIDALEEDTREIIKLEEGFEHKIDSVFEYAAAVQAVKELYPELKEEEIAAAGCLGELLDPLCRDVLGFAIPQSEEGRHYKVVLADEITGPVPEADVVLYLNTAQDFRFADRKPDIFKKMALIGVSVRSISGDSLEKAKDTAVLADAVKEEDREALERFRFQKEFSRAGLVMDVGYETREEKEYGKIMAEILWISRKKETEQNGRLCLPPRRRNVSREDVEALRQLCSVIKKEEETDENHRIRTNETE